MRGREERKRERERREGAGSILVSGPHTVKDKLREIPQKQRKVVCGPETKSIFCPLSQLSPTFITTTLPPPP